MGPRRSRTTIAAAAVIARSLRTDTARFLACLSAVKGTARLLLFAWTLICDTDPGLSKSRSVPGRASWAGPGLAAAKATGDSPPAEWVET